MQQPQVSGRSGLIDSSFHCWSTRGCTTKTESVQDVIEDFYDVDERSDEDMNLHNFDRNQEIFIVVSRNSVFRIPSMKVGFWMKIFSIRTGLRSPGLQGNSGRKRRYSIFRNE